MAKTFSVKYAGSVRNEEFWLWVRRSDAVWIFFPNRTRFTSVDNAIDAVHKAFGPDFEHFGVFPNS